MITDKWVTPYVLFLRKYAASSEKAPGQQELFGEADQVELNANARVVVS